MTRIAVLFAAAATAFANHDHKKWNDYGGGPDNSHFVDLKQITPANVNQLQVAWTYPTQDSVAYLFNPIIVDNLMYVLARNYSLVALDAESGREIWIHENLAFGATANLLRTRRGIQIFLRPQYAQSQ